MKKKLFFFLFFLITATNFNSISYSGSSSLCSDKFTKESLKKINQIPIKKIEIDIIKYKKWTVNSTRIITNNSRFTPEKYKKRFNAKILVTYENNIQCIFKGRIRHSGDAKDHIRLQGNSIIQSLDVHLDNGNIKGITKFKLFKPGTRGEPQDVIIITELLRYLNYLAPRSIKVNVRINQAEAVMLFQEKAAKELLEFNNRREGPILEADQRFFFKLVEKIPDNQLSNWSVQLPVLRSKSIKAMLAKQLNPEIIFKSENHKMISYNALTNLNLIYLYYSNRFKDNKNNFYYFDYDLDNTLLGFFNPKNIRKLDMYNILMQATNSQHGLSASNRKFYWNSIENYFEPISYDLNTHFSFNFPTTTTVPYRLPVSGQLFKAFDELETKLANLNLKNFLIKINLSGVDETEAALQEKMNEVFYHLNRIKNNYLSVSNEVIEHNKFKPMNNLLNGFSKTLSEIDPNVYLVKNNANNKMFQRCKINLKSCEDYKLSKENLPDLLEGELEVDKRAYQYLGKNLNFENITKYKSYKKIK